MAPIRVSERYPGRPRHRHSGRGGRDRRKGFYGSANGAGKQPGRTASRVSARATQDNPAVRKTLVHIDQRGRVFHNPRHQPFGNAFARPVFAQARRRQQLDERRTVDPAKSYSITTALQSSTPRRAACLVSEPPSRPTIGLMDPVASPPGRAVQPGPNSRRMAMDRR